MALSQVVAEGDTTLCDGDQGNVSVTLTATSYSVDLIDSGISSDDIFSGVINLGFDFIFYGNTYSQVTLSSNNFLSFNLANAGVPAQWEIFNPIPDNSGLSDETMNGILCPWQDINPGFNGNGIIQYATTGESPNRVFIASFCGIPMFNCTDICYSSQIKLFETTNIIETHIAQKVLCTAWNGGAAIHGLHNIDGTIAHVVTGLDGIERNFPNQWTCENDGWRFTPNGSNDYILESIEFAPAVAGTDIIWQDQFGNQIGTGGEIIVMPGGDVTYTAGASLCGSAGDWCGFEGGIEGDDVSITFESANITGFESTDVTCEPGSTDGSAFIVLDGSGPFEYSWEDSSGNIVSTQQNLLNAPSDIYQFTVSTVNGCEDTIEILIDIDGVPVSNSDAGQDIEICEDEAVLVANNPLQGESGVWTLVSGEGTIDAPNSSEVNVFNLGFGQNIFAWTLENECGVSIDEVTINVIDATPAIINQDALYCLEEIPLVVEVQTDEGQWAVSPEEGVTIDDSFSTNTFATVENYGQYIFSFESCNGIDFETFVIETSAPELSGPEQVYCMESFQLEASIDGDLGFWTATGPGTVNFDNDINLNPIVTVDDYGVYEFTYFGCGASSTIMVDMISPNPLIEDPGTVYCSFETELSAISLTEGSWSAGDIPSNTDISINDNGNTVLISVSDYGIYEVIFTSCGVSDTLALLFDTDQPYIMASDHQNCLLTIDLYAITPAFNPGPWEQISGPSIAQIINPYSNITQAIVSEFGIYEFSFFACDTISTVQIGVSCPISVPNTFSPNGDGVNDIFQISDLNPNVYTQSILYVYNKWGAVVYINPNYGLDGDWWDGKTTYSEKSNSMFLPERFYDNASGYVNDGIYFYTLETYNATNKQKEFYSGDINIFSK